MVRILQNLLIRWIKYAKIINNMKCQKNRGEDMSLRTLTIIYITSFILWLVIMFTMLLNGMMMGFLMNLGFFVIEMLCVSLFMINMKDDQ